MFALIAAWWCGNDGFSPKVIVNICIFYYLFLNPEKKGMTVLCHISFQWRKQLVRTSGGSRKRAKIAPKSRWVLEIGSIGRQWLMKGCSAGSVLTELVKTSGDQRGLGSYLDGTGSAFLGYVREFMTRIVVFIEYRLIMRQMICWWVNQANATHTQA